MPARNPRLEKEADAAWGRYESTCRTGGTPEQRLWACGLAVEATRKASAASMTKQDALDEAKAAQPELATPARKKR